MKAHKVHAIVEGLLRVIGGNCTEVSTLLTCEETPLLHCFADLLHRFWHGLGFYLDGMEVYVCSPHSRKYEHAHDHAYIFSEIQPPIVFRRMPLSCRRKPYWDALFDHDSNDALLRKKFQLNTRLLPTASAGMKTPSHIINVALPAPVCCGGVVGLFAHQLYSGRIKFDV